MKKYLTNLFASLIKGIGVLAMNAGAIIAELDE